jgi:hypothetical protein
MRRRALLSALAAGLAGTAGCLGGGPGDTASPTDTPTDSPTPTPDDPSPSPDGDTPVTTATNVFDPDKPVVLENDDDVAHEFALTVTGPDGDVVHESTHDLAAGAELTAYNLSEADPREIADYEVAVTVGEQTGSVTIQTSSCYGGAYATVAEDGVLDVFYAIC